MTEWVYSETVKQHFMHPKNLLLDAKDYKYDAMGEAGSVQCGDQMAMYLQIDAEKEIITDCKWKTYGCASAIASTSALSEMVIGMTLKDAYNIKPKDIIDKLGGLPQNKIHCSVLGDQALRAAIDDYYERKAAKPD